MNLRVPVAALFRIALAVLFLSAAAVAQDNPANNNGGDKAAPAKVEADPLGRNTPQGMVKGLIAALGARDYERAERYFEGTGTAKGRQAAARTKAVQQFHEVLDRAGTVTTPPEISLDPQGNVNDGLPEDEERFGTVHGDGKGKDIALLAKRVEKDGVQLWLVSADTLADVTGLAKPSAVSPASLLTQVPDGPNVAGAPLAHWLALLLLGIMSFVLASILVMSRWIVLWVLKRRGVTEKSGLAKFIEAAAMPLRMMIAVGIFIGVVGTQQLGISLLPRYHGVFLAQFIGGIGLAWFVWRLATATSVYMLDQMSRRGQATAYSVVSFLKRIVQVAIITAFAFSVIRSLGVDITTALAALGIGGIAIALGAQRLFENLIGGLTLVADQPVRVGDFCRFGEALGTVEDIGIRSTRVRTLDRTIVTVPNGEFASMQIENYSTRDRFWFHPVLNLRYETSPDQIRFLLQELRAMLYAHPRVNAEPARVRFVGLNAYSIDLEIFAYVSATNFDEFLEVQEDLLLRCMEIVDRSGTGFAFPSQTLYVSRDHGLNEEKSRKAEQAVQTWRETSSLQIPRFDSDMIHMLRETIAYPPEGSAVSPKTKLNGAGTVANR